MGDTQKSVYIDRLRDVPRNAKLKSEELSYPMNGLKVFEFVDIFFLSDCVKGVQISVLILRQWDTL